MPYHPLGESTLNANEREDEKNRIVYRLQYKLDEMAKNERDFVERIMDENDVSVKQLFWLRDINDKY